MRIITGSLKGRTVPFNARRQGSIRLTSSRLKEAVFAMLGTPIAGLDFLDLCAGCGQMGLEAYSRGARVVMNEPDPRRYASLKRLVEAWQLCGLRLERQKAQRLVRDYQAQDRRFNYIYLDPPYQAVAGGQALVLAVLGQLGDQPPLATDGMLFVQHQAELDLPPRAGRLERIQQREYGQTTLSLYQPEE